MTRLFAAPRRHDPYWDLDGAGARRTRTRRVIVRNVTWALILAVFAVVAMNLPAIDPDYLVRGSGRPLLAGALLMLLGSACILALARIERTRHS